MPDPSRSDDKKHSDHAGAGAAPATDVRIATFNVENLMARFDFSGWRDAQRRDRSIAGKDAPTRADFKVLEQARVVAHEDDARQMTALAIADCGADIICLQEVENLETLEAFERNYLARMTGLSYPEKVWIEGNDSRGIDVALMARETTATGEPIEIRKVTSHQTETFERLGVYNADLAALGLGRKERVFRRDCLEVDLRIGGRPVTIFVCHFKSMGSSREGVTGREHTMPVRLAEARGVRKLIERKFGETRCDRMRWIICGDLNDYSERLAITGNRSAGYQFTLKQEDHSGIEPLIAHGFSHNIVARRPENDRWTLFYTNGPALSARVPDERSERHLVQLDYILLSPAMEKNNRTVVPDIIRAGQPHRTVFPPGQEVERYPRTGWDRPKASDHCPVAATLKIV